MEPSYFCVYNEAHTDSYLHGINDLPHNYNIVRELSRQLFCDEIIGVGGNAQKSACFSA